MTKLTKPLRRRIGDDLVVELREGGVALRRPKKKVWLFVGWQQLVQFSAQGAGMPLSREEWADMGSVLDRVARLKRRRA